MPFSTINKWKIKKSWPKNVSFWIFILPGMWKIALFPILKRDKFDPNKDKN